MAFALRPTYRRLVAFNPGYCDEARALFAAMTVQPTRGRKARINEFINRLKAAGVWAKTDVMWVLAAHDEQAARLNWKSPGSFTLTALNSPTFATDRGFTGNASNSYLDTGWDALTNGVGFTQNDAHIGVYARSNGTAGGLGTTTGLRNSVVAQSPGAGSRVRINTDTLGTNPTANGTHPVHRIGTRRASSTTVIPILDGVAETGLALTSAAMTTSDFAFFRHNDTSYGSPQIAAGHVGAGLSDADGLALYNALHEYMVAVGADT